jgi:hypothetical protein
MPPLAADIGYYSVKSIGLSRIGGRKACTLLQAARHNLREIQAEQGARGNIDPARTRQNRIMAGPSTATEVQAHADTVLASINQPKLRRDHCQAIEVVFSLPVGSRIECLQYFQACLTWLRKTMSLPILSAVVHHDEAARHMHVLLLPVSNGKHLGSAPIAKPKLRHLRNDFFDKVAGPFGLRREGARLHGANKQLAVAAVLTWADQNGLPASCGPMWCILEEAVKLDPTHSVKALGIDLHTIRRAGASKQLTDSASPIGFDTGEQKHQALSCVGFDRSTALDDHQENGSRSSTVMGDPEADEKEFLINVDAEVAVASVNPKPAMSTLPALLMEIGFQRWQSIVQRLDQA